MWESDVRGRVLHFRLAGINNQNFIMRDEETGSWWQQVTGEAIQGPLKGEKLKAVYSDELTFQIWKRENPAGRVLRPDEKMLGAGNYEADWEPQVAKMPVRVSAPPDKTLEPRTLIAGIVAGGESKAFPVAALEKERLVVSMVGGRQIMVVLGEDNKSVRAFETEVDGRGLEFFLKTDVERFELTDAETGSVWDFSGRATGGKLAGKRLNKIPVLKDYWFDWKTYHPETRVYKPRDQ